MSCTSCLSNDDIQTPDQISVPCTTPYFHKDTLTPPSSLRSPPLEGGGISTYAACDVSLYKYALYFEIYTPPLEGILIQLMSIAGYEAFVCVCFSCIKHYVQPSYGCCGMPVVARMCVYTLHFFKNTYNLITKKYRNKNEKH